MVIFFKLPDSKKNYLIVHHILNVMRVRYRSHRRPGVRMNKYRLRPVLFQRITTCTQLNGRIDRRTPMIS